MVFNFEMFIRAGKLVKWKTIRRDFLALKWFNQNLVKSFSFLNNHL